METREAAVIQCEVAYWQALAVGSAAQLAAAHCPLPERTDFGPAVYAATHLLCPSQSHYGLHPAMFSGNDSLF